MYNLISFYLWITHETVTIIKIISISITPKSFFVPLRFFLIGPCHTYSYPITALPLPPAPCSQPPTDMLSVTLDLCFLEFHIQKVIHCISFPGGVWHLLWNIIILIVLFLNSLMLCVSIVYSFLFHGIGIPQFIYLPVDGCISLLGLPLTKYHKLSDLNSRIYCLMILDTRSLRSRCEGCEKNGEY